MDVILGRNYVNNNNNNISFIILNPFFCYDFFFKSIRSRPPSFKMMEEGRKGDEKEVEKEAIIYPLQKKKEARVIPLFFLLREISKTSN